MIDFRFVPHYPFAINFIKKEPDLFNAYDMLVICYFTGIT